MAADIELQQLLDTTGARVLAFDHRGGLSVPLPASLTTGRATPLAATDPLDALTSDSHRRALVAFEHARRRGRGSALVKMAGESQRSVLEIFDAREPHGCFVAITIPGADGGLGGLSPELAAQAALEQRERLLHRLNQALPTGVLQLDPDGEVVIQNDRWLQLIGPSNYQGLGALLERLSDPSPVERAVEWAMGEAMDADLAVTLDGSGICRFGELHIRPLEEGGIISGLLLTLDDVTRLQVYQMELTEQARRDPLTRVHNRLGIEELIHHRLADRRQGALGLTVLFLDLDRFKAINDEHGHLVGDKVLQSVAVGIQSMLRGGDHLGRLGGDEFLVVLGPDTPKSQAAGLARRISEAVPVIGDGLRPMDIGASIGIAHAVADDDFDSLIKRADAAMYEAKNRSRRDSPAGPAGQ